MQTVMPPIDVAVRICEDVEQGFREAADRLAQGLLPILQRLAAATKPSTEASAPTGDEHTK